MALPPRIRRLKRDYEKLQELAARSKFVSIQQTEGDPPEKYVIHLACKGVVEVDPRGKPKYAESHQLGIHLVGYPDTAPKFVMLTPVVHPNIGRGGDICIGDEGDHGFAPGMGLDDLIVRIVEIIRYSNVGMGNPLNSVANEWARRNSNLFPLQNDQIVGEQLVNLEDIEIVVAEHDESLQDLLNDIVIIDPLADDDLDIVFFE